MRELYKTDIEEIMEKALKEANIKFTSQFPIRGSYILDIAISELKIDIECDGEHYHILGNDKDRKRNWSLRNKGWIILRFRGEEIKNNIQFCINKIKETIEKEVRKSEIKKNKS